MSIRAVSGPPTFVEASDRSACSMELASRGLTSLRECRSHQGSAQHAGDGGPRREGDADAVARITEAMARITLTAKYVSYLDLITGTQVSYRKVFEALKRGATASRGFGDLRIRLGIRLFTGDRLLLVDSLGGLRRGNRAALGCGSHQPHHRIDCRRMRKPGRGGTSTASRVSRSGRIGFLPGAQR
jgi:hypothetical protein